jgi:hypothetical protein
MNPSPEAFDFIDYVAGFGQFTVRKPGFFQNQAGVIK